MSWLLVSYVSVWDVGPACNSLWRKLRNPAFPPSPKTSREWRWQHGWRWCHSPIFSNISESSDSDDVIRIRKRRWRSHLHLQMWLCLEKLMWEVRMAQLEPPAFRINCLDLGTIKMTAATAELNIVAPETFKTLMILQLRPCSPLPRGVQPT